MIFISYIYTHRGMCVMHILHIHIQYYIYIFNGYVYMYAHTNLYVVIHMQYMFK
jgi:hypothetical protein